MQFSGGTTETQQPRLEREINDTSRRLRAATGISTDTGEVVTYENLGVSYDIEAPMERGGETPLAEKKYTPRHAAQPTTPAPSTPTEQTNKSANANISSRHRLERGINKGRTAAAAVGSIVLGTSILLEAVSAYKPSEVASYIFALISTH